MDSTIMHINDLPIPIPIPIHQRGLILIKHDYYRESNKESKERHTPILGVRFTEVSVL